MDAYMNSTGLALDIIGVALLFLYGLPKDIHKKGVPNMNWDGQLMDPEGWNFYKFLSRVGLIIIILGFLLQLISNHI